MFYYINGTCLDLNRVICLSINQFTTPIGDTDGDEVQTVYTLNIALEGLSNPLIITYLDKDARDSDMRELVDVLGAHGRQEFNKDKR